MRLNRFYFDQAISIDNALTTNQIIHQLITQINKIIDTINDFETDAHKYTDLKVGELRVELNNQVERLEDLIDSRENILRDLIYEKSAEAENNAKSYTDAELEVLKSDYIQPIVEEIYNTIRLIENRLDAKIDGVDARLTNLIEETKAELIDLIKKGGAIYSGYSGLLTSLQNEINNGIINYVAQMFGITWDLFESKYWGRYDFQYCSGANNNLKVIFDSTDFKGCFLKNASGDSLTIGTSTWEWQGVVEPALTVTTQLPQNSTIHGSTSVKTSVGTSINLPFLLDDTTYVLTVYIPLSVMNTVSSGYINIPYERNTFLDSIRFYFANDKYENLVCWDGIEAFISATNFNITYNKLLFFASFKYNITTKLSSLSAQAVSTMVSGLYANGLIDNTTKFFSASTWGYKEPNNYDNQVWSNKLINNFFE